MNYLGTPEKKQYQSDKQTQYQWNFKSKNGFKNLKEVLFYFTLVRVHNNINNQHTIAINWNKNVHIYQNLIMKH